MISMLLNVQARSSESQTKQSVPFFQNVLDMERSLFQQQDNMVRSRGLVAQDVVQIYRALGGGWEEVVKEDDEEINDESNNLEE